MALIVPLGLNRLNYIGAKGLNKVAECTTIRALHLIGEHLPHNPLGGVR